MRIKMRLWLPVYICTIMHFMQATPPPPPPLTGQLANQTLAQLMQLFGQNGLSLIQQSISGVSGLTLSMLATTPLQNSGLSTSTLTDHALQYSTSTIKSSSVVENPSDVALISNILSDPSVPLATRARIGFGRNNDAQGNPIKITASTKYQMSPAAQAINKGFISNFTGNTTISLPPLNFPDASVTAAYNEFAASLSLVPGFISMFKKIHIIALHELYLYLIGIYATFNLTNIADLKTYVVLENQLGLSKKTLIISYLVNLIEAQLTSVIQSIMPGMPQQVAIKAGVSGLRNQGANPLDMLVLDMEKTVLALLHISPLTASQIATLLSALTSPENSSLIEENTNLNQTDYKNTLSIISKAGINFISQLTEPQADALLEAIDTITVGISNAQEISSMQNIVDYLQAPTQAQPLSIQEIMEFKSLVNQITYGVPFTQIFTISQSLAQKINTQSSDPLTAIEKSTLLSIISSLSLQTEQNLSSQTTTVLEILNSLNPQGSVLSVSQSINLQILATGMLNSQNPLLLENLKDQDRAVLSRALLIFSQNTPNELMIHKELYNPLAIQLSKAPIDKNALTPAQQSALQSALQYLASYTFSDTTLTNAENAFSAEDQATIVRVINSINNSNFTSLNQFSKKEQELMQIAFQKLDAVTQSRIALHTEDASLINSILQEDTDSISQILTAISMEDYQSLAYLYNYLKSQQGQTSIASISAQYVNQNPSPISALKTAFNPSQDPMGSTYIDLINQIQEYNDSNTVIQHVITSLSPQDTKTYQSISESIRASRLSLPSFTPVQTELLLSFFQPFLTSLQESSQASAENKSSPTTQLLQTIYALVGQTHAFNTAKASYLWVLKKYLIFFNAYTASLQTYTSNIYEGSTKFEKTAQYVSSVLKDNPLQTVNPPLFLFDESSMRSIKMIPQVARLIEGTASVPYPTFCIEQCLKGSTINPLDGIKYSNTVSIGQGAFSYQKFFFIDTLQQRNTASDGAIIVNPSLSPPELTGKNAQSISWIQKVSIPVSDQKIIAQNGSQITNYDHAYIAKNIPSDISGFYMNIPVFDTDPANSNRVVIRLFEQKINAQPDWMNYSGFENNGKDTMPNIMTVLRGCLGDFLSILNLGIFDPCLTVIFKAALIIDDPDTSFSSLTKENPNLTKQVNDCAAYLEEKTAMNQRMVQATTVTNQNIIPSQQSTASGKIL